MQAHDEVKEMSLKPTLTLPPLSLHGPGPHHASMGGHERDVGLRHRGIVSP
jgi:hypothetical protein